MGKWSDDFKAVVEPLISFNSWEELHKWNEEVNAREGCSLLQEQFVLNCYALYRFGELNDVTSSIYTDGYEGKQFTVTAEVPVNDNAFDLSSLPMYWAIVEGEKVPLYPEEIFVNY